MKNAVYVILVTGFVVFVYFNFMHRQDIPVIENNSNPTKQGIDATIEEINKNTKHLKIERLDGNRMTISAREKPQTLNEQFSEFESQLNDLGIEQIYSSRNNFIVFGKYNEKIQTSYDGNVTIRTNPFTITASSGSLETPFDCEDFRNELNRIIQIINTKTQRSNQ